MICSLLRDLLWDRRHSRYVGPSVPARRWRGLFSPILACLLGACRFDPSGLPSPDGGPPDSQVMRCGDGVRQGSEECDKDDLGGATCLSLTGMSEGSLTCTSSCQIDSTGCHECGNGTVEGPEACDSTQFGGATCLSFAGMSEGSLTCTPSCQIDSTGCHECGNGTVEGPEECDSASGGQTCLDLGFNGGDLACGQDCRLDTSGCFTCGDGMCDHGLGEGWDNCPTDCSWQQIDAGLAHTCAVRRDGSAWCWGHNDVGQVGDGSDLDQPLPASVLLSPTVVQISAGGNTSCAVLADTTVFCWGANDRGQLGDGSTTSRSVPAPVPNLSGVLSVDVGGGHVCALTNQGEVYCWGRNNKGQLGDGSTTERHSPVLVAQDTGLTYAVSLSAGGTHTCAVDATGQAYCWGDRGNGRLGDNSNQDQLRPAAVSTDSGLGSTLQISAGTKHTCALDTTGRVWCWGSGGNGRLGDDSNSDQPVPVQVDSTGGLQAAVRVTAGDAHTCAVRQDGVIFCWGKGGSGQIGDGQSTDRTVPTLLDHGSGMPGAVGVSAGGEHTVAWTAGGQGWAWGAGALGQLGTGTTTGEPSPVAIPGT